MKESLLDILRCPLTKDKLSLQVLEREERSYGSQKISEVKSGILTSPCGYIFPIVGGVPRLQAESFIEHEDFLRKNLGNKFDEIKSNLHLKFSQVIKLAIKRNWKTKHSFGMEWSVFQHGSDTTWDFTKDSRKQRFLKEAGLEASSLKSKRLIDVGCGNGVLTSGISEFGCETVGLDVSRSVEEAYTHNTNPNVHYIQGDLQLPPFAPETFDVVYSAGVIHHTNNTELSFSCISELVKTGGVLFVWLYRPEEDLKHHLLNYTRGFTNKLPLPIQYALYLCLLVPQGLLKMKLKGVKRNWREQLIAYFDVLSPEFRYEHTPDEVEGWYFKRGFKKPVLTIEEYLGFGIVGEKK